MAGAGAGVAAMIAEAIKASFAFFTKTSEPLYLPNNAEVAHAKKIWIPG